MNNLNNKTDKSAGVFYGAASFTIWGFLPLYWKLVKQVPADEILAHRIIWSFVFVMIILLFTNKIGAFAKVFSDKKSVVLISLSSILIAINWFVYIWAVNSSHIIEASMGYYINPLIAVLLGVTFLKEKLNIYHSAALILAATGVAIIIIRYGKIPWISLTLAISFALYGLLKKLINVDASVGMALETAILSPFALIYVGFKQLNGTGSLGHISFGVMTLLLLAGVATATPLLLFAKGAQRINLSVVGFLQYISPTISLLLGVLVFHEIFSQAAFLSFSFIWASLIVFSLQGIFLKQMKTV